MRSASEILIHVTALWFSPSLASTICQPGVGRWCGDEFYSLRPECQLQQFMRHGLPRSFGNTSIFLIGDSVDARALTKTCEHLKGTSDIYLQPREPKAHRFCRIPVTPHSYLTIANFYNYGVFSEQLPYWRKIYKNNNTKLGLPKGWHSHSYDHIRFEATQIRSVLPRRQDPTLIVVSSYLWDIAQDWQNQGHLADNYTPGPEFVDRWVPHVQSYLEVVRSTFPRSHLVWRTAPPATGKGRNPPLVHEMNSAVREHLLALAANRPGLIDSLPIDYESMMLGRIPEPPPQDGVHPGPKSSLAFMNVVFNYLLEHGLGNRGQPKAQGQVPFECSHKDSFEHPLRNQPDLERASVTATAKSSSSTLAPGHSKVSKTSKDTRKSNMGHSRQKGFDHSTMEPKGTPKKHSLLEVARHGWVGWSLAPRVLGNGNDW